MSLIFFPLMPPLSFTQATASCTPWAKGLPTSEVTPVRSKMPPTLISCWAEAQEGERIARAAATRVARDLRGVMCPPLSLTVNCTGLAAGLLVRERVQLPVRLDVVPPGGHPVRLEDQEEDHHQAEDPGLDGSDDDHEAGPVVAERVSGEAQHLRQQGDEDGAEDG